MVQAKSIQLTNGYWEYFLYQYYRSNRNPSFTVAYVLETNIQSTPNPPTLLDTDDWQEGALSAEFCEPEYRMEIFV
jgi:hypothetical protein